MQGHRAADVVALREVTAEFGESRVRAGVLDTFGNDVEGEVARQVGDRPHDGLIVRVPVDVGDEALVDLHLVDRQAGQVSERRVARTEIVDG